MQLKVDLHMHSTYSDGADTIEELFQKASAKGLTHMSIVDHDTTDHIEPAFNLSKEYGIQFIPGIEISAYDFKRNRKVHILGYDFQQNYHIKALCDPLLQKRHKHSLWQLEQIISSGFDITEEQVMSFVKEGGILYKQHIMNALTESPFNSEKYQKLYKSLFKGNGVASGDIDYLDAFEAVKAIVADGGYAVCAHPGQLDSYDIAEELVPFGLKGVESTHPDHKEEQVNRIVKIARDHHLFLTGGSDDHGRYGAVLNSENYIVENMEHVPFIK